MAIANVSNVSFSDALFSLTTFIPDLHASCLAIGRLWESALQNPLTSCLADCNQTTCAIPNETLLRIANSLRNRTGCGFPTCEPLNSVWIAHLRNQTGCDFSIAPDKEGPQISTNRLGTETISNVLFDKNKLKYIVDNENKKLHVQWEVPQSNNESWTGEFKINLYPDTKKFEVLFKNGAEDISGECLVGQKKPLSCRVTPNRWLFKPFSSITVDIEEQASSSRVKEYVLSILSHPFPFFSSSTEIGRARFSLDEENRRGVFSGLIKSPNEAQLNANFSHEINKDNSANFSFNIFEKENLISLSLGPKRFNFNLLKSKELLNLDATLDREKGHYSAVFQDKNIGKEDEEFVMNLDATLLETVQNLCFDSLERNIDHEENLKKDFCEAKPSRNFYSSQRNFSHNFKEGLCEFEVSNSNGYEFTQKYNRSKN